MIGNGKFEPFTAWNDIQLRYNYKLDCSDRLFLDISKSNFIFVFFPKYLNPRKKSRKSWEKHHKEECHLAQ
jgi:hypothetical protein